MAWIESHQALREHPKLYEIMDSLKISKAQAVGHLHLFWWWCVDYAPKGQLRHNDAQIARAAEWSGDPKRFVESLINAKLLDRVDGVLTVHDWLDFCGALMDKRLKRMAEKAGAERLPMGAEREPTNQPTVPTVPNQPKALLPSVNKNLSLTDQRRNFEDIWLRYPNKDGRKLALRAFLSSVKTEKDWTDINSALSHYLKSEKVAKGFIKNGSTWFNNWTDWVNFQEADIKGFGKSENLKKLEEMMEAKSA